MVQRGEAKRKQFTGVLSTDETAAAMQSARLNSIDLFDTADILFGLKRFAHSIPFSIWSIEESGKLIILQAILLGLGKPGELWRSYRSHRAKTEHLNFGILARIRTTLPEMSSEEAKEIASNGPTPDDLESAKQMAVYSDCFDQSGKVVCHLPRNIDWRQEAWERLCEARAIVFAPRDRSPEELSVWVKHVTAAQATGKSVGAVLPAIHDELVEKGLIEKGWWDKLFSDAEIYVSFRDAKANQ
jgi:AbiV family abortive infection protein